LNPVQPAPPIGRGTGGAHPPEPLPA
jgi:hypothetical protein